MSGRVEYEVAQVGATTLEKLAPYLLIEEGFDVHSSGTEGPDGGWDAEVEIGGMSGIAHMSTASRWRKKLRRDASKVNDLENRRGVDYDLFVFVTNQSVTGEQELQLREEIKKDYGWVLKLYHKRDLVQLLRADRPDLAKDYLNVDVENERQSKDDSVLQRLSEIGTEAKELPQRWGQSDLVMIDEEMVRNIDALKIDLQSIINQHSMGEEVTNKSEGLVDALTEAEPTFRLAADGDGGVIRLPPNFPDGEVTQYDKYQQSLARVVKGGKQLETAAGSRQTN